jgi:hypothetical protein
MFDTSKETVPRTSDVRGPAISLTRPSSSLQRSKSRALPRPLLLSLHAIPASPRSPAHLQLSPTRSSNIHSHDYSSDDDHLRVRRKRMAKLARTFGENVPPELVTEEPMRPSRPRSTSVDATALATFKVTVMGSDHPEPQPEKRSRTPVFAIRSSSLKLPSSPLVGQRRGHSSSLAMEGLHLARVESPYAGRKSSDTVCSTASSKSSSSEYRKQAGWSGEWNRDMSEVMVQLRGLKAS